MTGNEEEIHVTPAPVISAEFLLDAGDLDESHALATIVAEDGERSEVSFRPENPVVEEIYESLSSRCTSTRVEQVDHVPTTRRCTRRTDAEGNHVQRREDDDDMHEWMSPGHRVRWPRWPSPGFQEWAAAAAAEAARCAQLPESNVTMHDLRSNYNG